MISEKTVESTVPTPILDDLSRRVKRIGLGVATLFLLGGFVVVTVEPLFGLFATAVILGWAQIVGL